MAGSHVVHESWKNGLRVQASSIWRSRLCALEKSTADIVIALDSSQRSVTLSGAVLERIAAKGEGAQKG